MEINLLEQDLRTDCYTCRTFYIDAHKEFSVVFTNQNLSRCEPPEIGTCHGQYFHSEAGQADISWHLKTLAKNIKFKRMRAMVSVSEASC